MAPGSNFLQLWCYSCLNPTTRDRTTMIQIIYHCLFLTTFFVRKLVQTFYRKLSEHNVKAIQNTSLKLLPNTAGSMNNLFGDFFRKFGGIFLEVFETISGGFRMNFLGFSCGFFREDSEKYPGNVMEISV